MRSEVLYESFCNKRTDEMNSDAAVCTGAVLQSCRGSAGAIVGALIRFRFATQAVQLLRTAWFSSTLSPLPLVPSQ